MSTENIALKPAADNLANPDRAHALEEHIRELLHTSALKELLLCLGFPGVTESTTPHEAITTLINAPTIDTPLLARAPLTGSDFKLSTDHSWGGPVGSRRISFSRKDNEEVLVTFDGQAGQVLVTACELNTKHETKLSNASLFGQFSKDGQDLLDQTKGMIDFGMFAGVDDTPDYDKEAVESALKSLGCVLVQSTELASGDISIGFSHGNKHYVTGVLRTATSAAILVQEAVFQVETRIAFMPVNGSNGTILCLLCSPGNQAGTELYERVSG